MSRNQKDSWIKLYRKLLDDSLWKISTPEQKVLMITILLMVNHKEKEWTWEGKKFKVPVGGMLTSLKKIGKNAGKKISIEKIRVFIKKFQKYGFLTNTSTKTGRLIVVLNFDKYQNKIPKRLTNTYQSYNNHITSNNNDKNDKNNKYIHILDLWNSKKIIIHKPLEPIINQIKIAYKKYGNHSRDTISPSSFYVLEVIVYVTQ